MVSILNNVYFLFKFQQIVLTYSLVGCLRALCLSLPKSQTFYAHLCGRKLREKAKKHFKNLWIRGKEHKKV